MSELLAENLLSCFHVMVCLCPCMCDFLLTTVQGRCERLTHISQQLRQIACTWGGGDDGVIAHTAMWVIVHILVIKAGVSVGNRDCACELQHN